MNERKELVINDKRYYLVKNYKDDDKLRKSFNELTRKTFGFDFEQWYQQGYWQERYIPYSLLCDDVIVANVSVNTIDFLVNGELKHTIQIGTVMTDELYRNQGLITYLMETVFKEYEKRSDLIYLFANDSVLDFYPKYGFKKADEYQYIKQLKKKETAYVIRKLDMNDENDKNTFTRLASNAIPISKISMVDNFGLIMFYCSSFMKDNIYYIKDLDIAVVAGYDGNKLYLQDVFSEKDFNLEIVINELVNQENMTVTLGFTPLEDESYSIEILNEEDTTLFVKGNNIIGKSMFPILSHA
ncbi:GNAT family N-acetyltransferase [Abyssisolibacter fermentans]|uniref:GNAT family N-acetyltransferase n=1 Tax=Abyssisolibacter fermentans TaxID=1766203 RepID=UPI00082F4A9A|nr:GNAT family N-acetyltransferase [Abyssisolibacter fermentans]